jgi:putative ABC transport system ATP-binding protein
LDTRTSQELMALLQELNDTGISLVLVTHEPDIAAYAKRVLSLPRWPVRRRPTRDAPRRRAPNISWASAP